MTADHWVVLNSPILLDGKPISSFGRLPKHRHVVRGHDRSRPDIRKQQEANKQFDEFVAKKISFNVVTWGTDRWSVNTGRGAPQTVKEFLDYFYGYVAARK